MVGNPKVGYKAYRDCLINPGQYPVVPPLGNGTFLDRVIPLASTSGSYQDKVASWNAAGDFKGLLEMGIAPYRYLMVGTIPIATTFGVPQGQASQTSGVFMFQFESLDQKMTVANLFSAPGYSTIDIGSISYIDLIGSDASAIGSEMTSFASMFTLSLVGCESNKAKEAFYGSIPLGMLLSDEGDWKAITMQQLVNGARLHHQNSAEFTIVEHIRDNDAMLEFHKINTSSNVANYGDIAGEIMSYCIIDAPNRPLMVSGTTGPTAPYSPYQVQRELRINAIIYPKNDAISRSLGVHL